MIRTLLTFMVIIIPALYFGYEGKPTEMGLWVVVGAIAGAFLNLDKFASFKGAGFEAELRQVVNEAYATIDNMREVARPLIISMLSNITYSGRWLGSPQNDDEKHKEELIKLSKSLDIYDGEIIRAVNTLHRQFTWDKFEQIISLTSKLHDNKVENTGTVLSIELRELYNRESFNFPSEESIREVFSKVTLHSEVAKEAYEAAIKDYLFYLDLHKPRQF